MMPFHLFILTLVKKGRTADLNEIEHRERVRVLMDQAHEKTANFMNMM